MRRAPAGLFLPKPRNLKQHNVFKGIAARGQTSGHWFFGFKLHMVCHDIKYC
ncbi:transposase [Microcoleus sp. AR_TQ3_B6]|uniref:transposase n=1 Tax=Microcoleus sp. AR_TQ3_B6 TaxID=3055284 RepID=UPI00403F8DD4